MTTSVHSGLSRLLPPVALTAACVLFGAMSPGGSSGYALLAAAAVAALAAVLTRTGHLASARLQTSLRASGASGHVAAPTAYWCAVSVPHRPARPRAPGRR